MASESGYIQFRNAALNKQVVQVAGSAIFTREGEYTLDTTSSSGGFTLATAYLGNGEGTTTSISDTPDEAELESALSGSGGTWTATDLGGGLFTLINTVPGYSVSINSGSATVDEVIPAYSSPFDFDDPTTAADELAVMLGGASGDIAITPVTQNEEQLFTISGTGTYVAREDGLSQSVASESAADLQASLRSLAGDTGVNVTDNMNGTYTARWNADGVVGTNRPLISLWPAEQVGVTVSVSPIQQGGVYRWNWTAQNGLADMDLAEFECESIDLADADGIEPYGLVDQIGAADVAGESEIHNFFLNGAPDAGDLVINGITVANGASFVEADIEAAIENAGGANHQCTVTNVTGVLITYDPSHGDVDDNLLDFTGTTLTEGGNPVTPSTSVNTPGVDPVAGQSENITVGYTGSPEEGAAGVTNGSGTAGNIYFDHTASEVEADLEDAGATNYPNSASGDMPETTCTGDNNATYGAWYATNNGLAKASGKPEVVVEVEGSAGGDTFTASADLTAGGAEFAASASFTPPVFASTAALVHSGATFAATMDNTDIVYAATAGLTAPGAELAATCTHDDPNYTATMAATFGGVEFAASATHDDPNFTATAALVAGNAEFSGTASHNDPDYTATAGLTAPNAELAATVSHNDPDFTATAALTAGGADFAASAVFTAPVYTGTAGLVLGGVGFAGTATFVAPVFTATASLTVGGAEFGATMEFDSPVFAATAALVLGGVEFSGSASFTAPVFTGAAALVVGGVEFSAAASSASDFIPGPYYSDAFAFFTPGSVAGNFYSPGSRSGNWFTPGSVAGVAL